MSVITKGHEKMFGILSEEILKEFPKTSKMEIQDYVSEEDLFTRMYNLDSITKLLINDVRPTEDEVHFGACYMEPDDSNEIGYLYLMWFDVVEEGKGYATRFLACIDRMYERLGIPNDLRIVMIADRTMEAPDINGQESTVWGRIMSKFPNLNYMEV